ncbi:MAG: sulfide/dihydroorotate dehydrogenase-like FAD/NAD-binding protein [candidate division Zixibacteria bacterium]|nr:sulfide/dihydroorotate dehydrogenase-like FAD/NAD-binding protein [candidate division Zixibacteria bacterium]
MHKLVESKMIVPNIFLLTLEAPAVAREVKPGQFVILRVEEDGERIPLSVADWDRVKGTITIVLMNVGYTTDKLASLKAGASIPTVVGPLGNPTEIDKFGTVLCLGGCYGMGSLFPIVRGLKEKGNRVVAVLEARSSYLFYWEKKFEEISDRVFYITRDGSRGYPGHVGRLPEIIKFSGESVDRMIINGCTFLLKRGSDVSRESGIKTIVSLNPIMIDGTGMCGVCRVTVGSSTKFACVDGPDFDGHQVDWKELLQRRKMYLEEEIVPLRTSRCEEHKKESR